jgi:putative transposase
MKSERHFWATLNYVHHNPVKHRYVKRWVDWPWSSAARYLEEVGREEAERIWSEYPVLDYGKQWDL